MTRVALVVGQGFADQVAVLAERAKVWVWDRPEYVGVTRLNELTPVSEPGTERVFAFVYHMPDDSLTSRERVALELISIVNGYYGLQGPAR